MTEESTDLGGPAAGAASAASLPMAVDRTTFQAEPDRMRVREQAHTREGEAMDNSDALTLRLATTVARRTDAHADGRTPPRPVVATRSRPL